MVPETMDVHQNDADYINHREHPIKIKKPTTSKGVRKRFFFSKFSFFHVCRLSVEKEGLDFARVSDIKCNIATMAFDWPKSTLYLRFLLLSDFVRCLGGVRLQQARFLVARSCLPEQYNLLQQQN